MDPTRTTSLRRRFMRDMRKRFRRIRRLLVELIVDDDAFGLVPGQPFAVNVVERQAWRFQTDAQKIQSFRNWLQGEIESGVLETTGEGDPWTQPYVESAYRKGTIKAFSDARREYATENLDFYAGTREEFLNSAFSQPERLQKVRLLATRSFEELRGVTATMAQQLNRQLATSLANGEGPRVIARKLTRNVDTLSRTRAMTIARTEVIHAHAEGQLDSFEELGVEEVGVHAEWSTAGDDRVCPRCGAMEGALLTVKEARGLIPLHPNCRCAWIPAVEVEVKERRKALLRQVRAAIRAERPGATLREARASSTWAGKDLL